MYYMQENKTVNHSFLADASCLDESISYIVKNYRKLPEYTRFSRGDVHCAQLFPILTQICSSVSHRALL